MIQYRDNIQTTRINDGFTETLKETADFFAQRGLSITGKMEEILSESSLFGEYKQRLCAGLPADQAQDMALLFENARMQTLSEASVAGIQQIAGLQMPTIRKMWAKVALKHAIPTEVVKTPRFAISYTKAYIMGSDGVKHELPTALNKLDNGLAELPKLKKEDITVPSEDFDLFSLSEVTAGKELHDKIDKSFYIHSVTLDTNDDQTGDEEVVLQNVKTDLYGNIFCEVKSADGSVTDTLFAKVDFDEGTMTVTSIKGKVTAVKVDARITQETNTHGESVSFDVLTKDVNIGVGTHINAPLPIEWLQDTMAIYNIDGAAEVVDLMSQTVAQKLEIEIYNFLVKSIASNNVPYKGQFNMIPSAGYAGTPKDWREQLKTVIDHYAAKMKRDSNFHEGKFVIMGSPIDMMIIPNVDWTFQNTQDDMGGVKVAFNLGAYSGNNRYELVSSDLIPDGKIIMIFVPGIDRLMTYKYFPYTFNVQKDYRDPNFPNVPSIMMTKRHTIEEFTPLICEITIKNNNGSVPETSGY